MIYTLGDRKSYRNYQKESKTLNTRFEKEGKNHSGIGGTVFKTLEDAVSYRDSNCPQYAVWSLQADWEKDTIPILLSRGDLFRELLCNSLLLEEVA